MDHHSVRHALQHCFEEQWLVVEPGTADSAELRGVGLEVHWTTGGRVVQQVRNVAAEGAHGSFNPVERNGIGPAWGVTSDYSRESDFPAFSRSGALRPSSWSKKPASSPSVTTSASGRSDDDLEPLPALLDGLHRPVEHDLERRQLLVDVVLGLVLDRPGLGLGVVDHLLGPAPGLPDDLGPLHHPLGLGPAGVDDVLGLAAGLGEELLALLQEPAGLAQLLGQTGDRVVDQQRAGRRG